MRARALIGLCAASRFVPRRFTLAILRIFARAARFTRFEAQTLDNLERTLGQELSKQQRRTLARDVRLFAARLFEEWMFLARAAHGLRARGQVEAWLANQVEFDASCARLFSAAREGRGLLIATAHLGNWEVLAAALRMRGLDGAVVGLRKHRDPSSNWLVGIRSALSVRTIPQDAPPREVLGVLRAGGTLGLLCDLEVRRLSGIYVPFFGLEALTQTAPAALSRAAKLPVHPVRIVARGERYVVLAEEPLELAHDLPREAATRDLLAQLNRVYERWIREDPAQWAWHQPRWRTRPGERVAPALHSRTANP